MIRIRVERLDDDTGAATDLGELRMAELGAAPAVYCETAAGAAVMRDVRAALACLAPASLAVVRREACACSACMRPHHRYTAPSRAESRSYSHGTDCTCQACWPRGT